MYLSLSVGNELPDERFKKLKESYISGAGHMDVVTEKRALQHICQWRAKGILDLMQAEEVFVHSTKSGTNKNIITWKRIAYQHLMLFIKTILRLKC